MKIKRILLIVLMAIMIIIFNANFVYADSFSVDMATDKQNYAEGQTVEITVSISNIVSTTGLYGLSGKLTYSTDIFEPIVSNSNGVTESMSSVNGWGSPTYNSSTHEFSIVTASSAMSSQSIMKIKLKVKEGATLGKATIMLSDLQASNGAEDINTTAASVSVNIKNEEEEPSDIPQIVTTPSPEPSPVPSPKPSPVSIPTPSGSKLPQTGIQDYAVPVLLGALIICLISYIAYRRYKDI